MSKILDLRPMPSKPTKVVKAVLPRLRKTKLTRKSPLRRVSDKLRASLKIYHRVTKPLWLKLHPTCQFVWLGIPCGKKGTVHHKKGRGKYLNDVRFFMTVCSGHHDFIHFKEPRCAYSVGYLLEKWK